MMEWQRAGEGRFHFAALWVAIVTALFCALMPLGLPLTKASGSAFNPSNATVVLKSRTTSSPVATRLLAPDGDDAGKLPWVVMALALAALLGRSGSRGCIRPVPAPAIVSFDPARVRQARAPPFPHR